VRTSSTALDNIIAYDEGDGEAPLANPADFVAIMGGDSGGLQLWTRPEIGSYADLKGKLLAVDAIRTGFTFVLRAMLQKKGIAPSDYTLEAVGNTGARFARMQRGTDCVAGLLTAPTDIAAKALGFKRLDLATDVLGAYQAGVQVARRSWLAANADVAVRYVRAARRATAWIYDPANRADATAVLAERAKIPPDAAVALLPVLLDPKFGIDRNGAIDPNGVKTVLALRGTYTQKILTDPLKYYDATYFNRAT
jgi:ABC-type nitrate/sulfonate/bicarbonate transport system substrate-binding protein